MIDFFIKRPIFAGVIAILMALGGYIALQVLPVAQFPNVVPGVVQVTATYPGANAQVTGDSVTRPLELAINGVPGMIYMSSTSTATGSSNITVTFEVGYDLDIGAVDVQNYANSSLAQLPEAAQRQGVTFKKQSTNLVIVPSLTSPDGTYDSQFLGNYADIVVTPALQRVPGVGGVTNFGLLQYSVRIWMDTQKMAALGLTGDEVQDAIRAQNQDVVAGNSGAEPSSGNPDLTLQVTAEGRLTQVSQFEEIIVRTIPDGGVLRLKDIARVELGAVNYSTRSSLDGKPSALLGIYQNPEANALAVAEGVRKVMADLQPSFPDGVQGGICFDSTLFISASISELVETLFEAMALVLIVIFVFLQRLKTTLIPMIAIPVSLLATFIVLLALGFSINTLSMLGLVLAIGLVVDDAIVVVENVERKFEEGETDPRRAASRAMREVMGPIVATTLALVAVFVPASLMPGMTGQLYNQFAMTIAVSVVFSGINSLTLSPALCAALLRGGTHTRATRGPLGIFNAAFSRLEHGYEALVGALGHAWKGVVAALLVLLAGAAWIGMRSPTAFIPDEDNGYFFVLYELPPGASLPRLQEQSDRLREIISAQPGVKSVIQINGTNFLTNANQTYWGFMIPVLDDWDARGKGKSAFDIIDNCNRAFQSVPGAIAFAAPPPAIPGLGNVGGFQLQINDLTGAGGDQLWEVAQQFLAKARATPAVTGLTTTWSVGVPQVYLEVDRTKAEALGVNVGDVFSTLQAQFGSSFVNQFNRFGKVYQVYVQADAPNRMAPADLDKLYVRSRSGGMTPLAAFCAITPRPGGDVVTHYNAMNSVQINGNTAPGFSSGQAIKAMEDVAAATMTKGFDMEWTGIIMQQIEAGNAAPIVFTLSIIAVFLLLAAQYESWLLPLLVVLAVPGAVLGALLSLHLMGNPLDVYAQIGLVMLVGLAAKNAILIVEFAKDASDRGATPLEAARTAARLRLRPILMTSFAFILGALPLALASGPGANSRHSIGYVVVGGLLIGTTITLLLTPTLYVIIETIRERFGGVDPVRVRKRMAEDIHSEPAPGHAGSDRAAHG
jgi:hydrophobe/amphiphile efflux-1 (HAE1) family protein